MAPSNYPTYGYNYDQLTPTLAWSSYKTYYSPKLPQPKEKISLRYPSNHKLKGVRKPTPKGTIPKFKKNIHPLQFRLIFKSPVGIIQHKDLFYLPK